ncbi:MAG: hypothetical protein J0L58_02685 [Burkholderiales bacterium]|nr:hypothetical protein [Burkholderiales bacterium]
MSLYPERCILTLSEKPDEPGRVQGVLGLDASGVTAECTLVAQGYGGQPRAFLLRDYPICIEPLSALLLRLLALERGGHQLPLSGNVSSYASLSVYRGPTVNESSLIEHLVARSVPLTEELSLLQVEFADELDERSTSVLVKAHRSPWGLLERAVSRLWWAGGPPPELFPLNHVPVQAHQGVALVRQADIPVFARLRFVHQLGGFRGPSHDAFFADDWHRFLASLT